MFATLTLAGCSSNAASGTAASTPVSTTIAVTSAVSATESSSETVLSSSAPPTSQPVGPSASTTRPSNVSPTTPASTPTAGSSSKPAATPTGTFAENESFVWIPAGDHRVPGTLSLPAGSGPLPVVLMLHGDASSRDEVGDMYAREAAALAKQGIASLRIDFAGSGASEEPETALTYPNMVKDATASLDFLKGDSRFDPTRISILGFSRGGTVAATLAGTEKDVAALASWSGAISNGTHEDPANEAKARKSGHVVVDLGFRTFDYSIDWFTTIAASHALTDVQDYTGPILVVVGSKDTDVPPAVAEKFVDTVSSTDVTVHTVKGADHIYGVLGDDQAMADDVIATTADWFADKIGD
jgi:dienelactone hydrolase